jgi:hypothetical protein
MLLTTTEIPNTTKIYKKLYFITLNMPRRPIWGVEVQLYSFLNLSTTWGWAVNATLQLLYPR